MKSLHKRNTTFKNQESLVWKRDTYLLSTSGNTALPLPSQDLVQNSVSSSLLNFLWWWPETQSWCQTPRMKEAQEWLMKFTSRDAENTQVGHGVHRRNPPTIALCHEFVELSEEFVQNLRTCMAWFWLSPWLNGNGIHIHEPRVIPSLLYPTIWGKHWWFLLHGRWPKQLGKRCK